MAEDPVTRLKTILRHMETLREAIPDERGLELGNVALADTVDWLDCYIDELERRPSSQPLMGDREKISDEALKAAARHSLLVMAAAETDPATRARAEQQIADIDADDWVIGWADLLPGFRAFADAILASLPAQGGEPVAWRHETSAEHIARDMRDGIFPERSNARMVMVGNCSDCVNDQCTMNCSSASLAHPVPEQDGWRDMSVEPDGPCGVLFHYPRERHADLVPGHDYSVRCGAWTGKYFVEQGTGHDVFEHEDREDWPTAWRPLPLPEQEAV